MDYATHGIKTINKNDEIFKFNLSVNRTNPSLHYTRNNINLVCNFVNNIKANLADDELMLISGAIVNNNKCRINELIIPTINYNKNEQIIINPIISLLDDITNKQTNDNMSLQHKFINSFNRYIAKLHLVIVKESKKVKVLITEDDIKNLYNEQKGKCKLSGKQMTHIDYNGCDKMEITKWNISINKIDILKPHSKDNIQLICNIINLTKQDMTNDDFILFCNNIAKAKFIRINELTLNLIKK